MHAIPDWVSFGVHCPLGRQEGPLPWVQPVVAAGCSSSLEEWCAAPAAPYVRAAQGPCDRRLGTGCYPNAYFRPVPRARTFVVSCAARDADHRPLDRAWRNGERPARVVRGARRWHRAMRWLHAVVVPGYRPHCHGSLHSRAQRVRRAAAVGAAGAGPRGAPARAPER